MAGLELEKHKRQWDRLGELDPLWAVLTYPEGKFGRWQTDAFFRTGEDLVSKVLRVAGDLRLPENRNRALDFGCGVGRLTRALAPHFKECIGVDVSNSMIARASALHPNAANCKFLVNNDNDLRIFPKGHFDLVITMIVLQHMPSRDLVYQYIGEAVRVLAPGGVFIFQMPNFIPLRRRLQLRRKLYALLSALGVKDEFLYRKLRLHSMHMNYLPEQDVSTFVQDLGAKLLCVTPDTLAGNGISSRTYYVSR